MEDFSVKTLQIALTLKLWAFVAPAIGLRLKAVQGCNKADNCRCISTEILVT